MATWFPSEHPEQVRIAQALGIVRQLPATVGTVIGGMALGLVLQLQGDGFGLAALAWQAAMALFALSTVWRWRRMRGRPAPVSVSARHIHKSVALAGVYGTLGATAMVCWGGSVSPSVSAWMIGIGLALPAYAATAYYFVPPVALAFAGPIFASCVFVIQRDWMGRGGEVGLLLVTIHVLMSTYLVRRNWEHFCSLVELHVQKTRLAEALRTQTQELREAQSQLVAEARRAGMAQVATNMLHNVGNVLTSVNVSTHVLAARVRDSRAARVEDLAQLMHERPALMGLLQSDEKGRLLPGYVGELAQALAHEREELLAELARLGASVEHIKNVVAVQQTYAGASGVLEAVRLQDVVEDALRMQQEGLQRHGVQVRRAYEELPPAVLDKTRVMQVLVNLVDNARHAMREQPAGGRVLGVVVGRGPGGMEVRVSDSGCGIAPDNLSRIFSHGFTTKLDGHGFGLHSCAIAAREMGGELLVHSDGVGRGALFTLRLAAAHGPSATDHAET